MRNTYRPMGRFFCLLTLMTALFLIVSANTQAANPSTTQVTDIVYRADGEVAKGTVLISWPAFTTADGYAVAAGSLSVQLASGGAFAASLAPNTGAQPAGVYYKVVYQLDSQQPSTEYWVVPATGSTSIGSVRAKLMPPTVAAQVLTRDVAETNYVHTAGDSTVNGVVTFTAAPTVPNPEKATDAANKGYVDSASASGLAAPPAIGNVTPNASTFTTVNKVINPLAYGGSDIGVQVANAIAANSCGDGIVACSVQLPPTRQLTFSTTIALPQDTRLVCTPKAQNSQYATLNYNGNGYAVSLEGESSGIEGCDFNIGASATEGIHQAAPYTTVHNVSLNGGGRSTILHHITGANVTFDSDEKMWNLTGIGVQVDSSIDVFLKTFDVYGAISNGLTEQTSISLLVESGVGGLNVTDWSGGGSGLHGLVVRNTVNPNAGVPTWLNFHNFVSDCSGGGDGWLFDASLGAAQIGATFVDSWSAGAGQDCNQLTMTNASAAGVHISGGSGIHIVGGGKIRANASHGVLIDGAGLQGIEVADNQITANGFATNFLPQRRYALLNSYVRPAANNPGNYLYNLTATGTSGSTNPTWCQSVNCGITSGSTTWQNIGTASEADGIYVSSAVKQLSVHDNKIATQPESQGIITWGVRVDADSPASNIHDNTVSDALAGALKIPSGITLNLLAHDNNNTTSSQVVPQIALGPLSWRLPAGSSQGPAVIPNTVGTGSYIMGFGNNLGWNGSNFTTATDTASNGASLMGMNYASGAFSFYVIPSNSPASGQSVAPGAMAGYIKGTIDSNGFNGMLGKTMANDAYVNNLTVNGTCTGCGTGSGNLSSPGPIGNTTPNTGTFTTLNAQSVNGTLNAAVFPGADPCVQINSAIAALPSTGGVVDAAGFTAAQIGGGCSTTVNAGVASMTLRFGAGTRKLGGNPGINVTAPKVTIECPKASEGDSFNTVPATLMSNGRYPLIADTVQSPHGTDGLTVRNCYLDGNSVGTFGLFLPYGSSGHLENVYTRDFTSVGQFVLAGQWTSWASGSGGNGGDGLVLGYDSSVDGNPQFAGNGGSAIHIVSGGDVLHGVGTYKNRVHGIYVDGRAVGDWTGSSAYVQQSFIRPVTGNAGNFVYYTQTAGTTGGTRPGFCQTPGCTFADGSVTWINAGTGYGYSATSIFENAWWNFLESSNSTSNGFQAPSGFDADDIRIEGTVAHPAFQNNVSAAMVRQSEGNDSPAHGIHLINTNYATINNVQWVGAGYSNNSDLGGLRFEASKANTVSNVNCWFSYSNCLQLASANNSTFTGLNVVNNGLAGTSQAGTYAVTIDAGSVANTINDLNVRDDRGPAYSRGVSDAGTQTIIGNYRKSNLAANPDSYGAGFVQEFSLTSAPTYNAGSGQGFAWKSGGVQTGQLDAAGNWSVAGGVSAQSIPGHEYFVSKYASIQAAIDAAYNNGTVRGGATVIDDRLAPYSGPGFIVRDSVTLKLAATTYTITGTVSITMESPM